MTVSLTFDDVLAIRSGFDAPGSLIERKRGDLEAALGEPTQTWAGKPLHATPERQAAVLLRGIVAAHAFEDGNKRTAWMSCVTFLGLNGLDLRVRPLEASDRVVSVAIDRPSIDEITRWITGHTSAPGLAEQRRGGARNQASRALVAARPTREAPVRESRSTGTHPDMEP